VQQRHMLWRLHVSKREMLEGASRRAERRGAVASGLARCSARNFTTPPRLDASDRRSSSMAARRCTPLSSDTLPWRPCARTRVAGMQLGPRDDGRTVHCVSAHITRLGPGGHCPGPGGQRVPEGSACRLADAARQLAMRDDALRATVPEREGSTRTLGEVREADARRRERAPECGVDCPCSGRSSRSAIVGRLRRPFTPLAQSSCSAGEGTGVCDRPSASWHLAREAPARHLPPSPIRRATPRPLGRAHDPLGCLVHEALPSGAVEPPAVRPPAHSVARTIHLAALCTKLSQVEPSSRPPCDPPITRSRARSTWPPCA
jgi:hypothetical protein